MKQVYSLILLLLVSVCVYGQCPSPNFTFPTPVCAGNTVNFTNNTVGSNLSYSWDFCPADLTLAPTQDSIGLTYDGGYDGFTMANDNGHFYGFVSSFSSGTIYRLDFGNSLDNVPVQSILANAGVGSPVGSCMIKENGNWYGFVTSFGGAINRLDFGNSLGNAITGPQIHQIVSGLTSPYSIVIKKDNGKYYGFAGSYGGNISRIDFDSINQATPPYIPSMGIVNVNRPWYVAVEKFCNKWVCLASNYGNSSLTMIKFSSGLNSSTTDSYIATSGGGRFSGIDWIEEGCNIYAIASHNTNNLYKLNFGSDINNPSPTLSAPIAGIYYNDPRGLKIIKDSSKVRVFSMNWDGSGIGRTLSRFSFPNNCSSNYSVSNASTPPPVTFSTPGVYTVTLSATDTSGNNNMACNTITVLPKDTALFTLSHTTCSNTFSFVDATYPHMDSHRTWSFGDGNTSTLQNPSHTYSYPGVYTVTLSIVSTNGCTDSYSQNIIADSAIANFSYIGGCVDSVRFINLSIDSSNIINYRFWNFGDLTTSTNNNPAHSYDTSGQYTVTLTVGIGGCTSTFSSSVIYYALPNSSFSISSTCVNSPVIFNNTSTCSDPMSYYWGFGDGNNTTVMTPTHNYASVGSYNDTLIVTNTAHGCEDTLFRTIIISNPSGSQIQYTPSFICGNFPVNFSDNYLITPSSYYWDFGVTPIATSTSGSPSYTYLNPGNYTVTLIATTGTNCKDTATAIVHIDQGPIVHFWADSICLGNLTTLIDSSTTVSGFINRISWKFDDTIGLDTGISIMHQFQTCGAHWVVDSVFTNLGCVAIDSFQVIVFCTPVAGFTSSGLCSNAPINFYDTTTVVNGTATHWRWNYSDNSTFDTIKNPIHTFDSSGIHIITLYATSNHGCVDSVKDTIALYRGPLALFSYSPMNICLGTPVQYNDYSLPNGSINFWDWDFGDNGSFSNQTPPPHIYTASGIYNVVLTVTTVISTTTLCTSSTTNQIIVYPKPVANFFSSNLCEKSPVLFLDSLYSLNDTSTHDTINWFSWTASSINQIGDSVYFTFPNAGTYPINLLVETEYGHCTSTITKNIMINPLPIPVFTFTPRDGTPPLTVTFENNTLPYISALWHFGDGDSSNAFNPIHTYLDNNCDTISLTIINTFGCKNTAYDSVCLNYQIIDMAISSITYTITGNHLDIFTTVADRGAVTINNYDIELNLGGNRIIQHYDDTLSLDLHDTNRSYHWTFVIDQYNPPQFVCARVENPNGINPDDNPNNDEQCLDLANDLLIFDIYPNPASNNIIIETIAPIGNEMVISLYDVLGQVVKILFDSSINKGYNKFEFPIFDLAKGQYLLSFDFREKRVVKKFNKL
ncbi:MAG: PKD domain-containing protein [Bacteroidota bacterium]